MAVWAQKVFWSNVTVAKSADGYTILLDERGLKTPLKFTLEVPTENLALAIADEWRVLEKHVDPEKLPITKLANSAIDNVAVQFEPIIEMLAEYAATDLLCYRATSPVGLADRQEQIWQPLLYWFERTHGVTLKVGSGVMPISQSADVLDMCSRLLATYSNFALAAIYDLISLSGSFVIGLAVADEYLAVSDGWDASRIDEDWQIQEWGDDEDARSLAQSRRIAFERAALVLKLLKK